MRCVRRIQTGRKSIFRKSLKAPAYHNAVFVAFLNAKTRPNFTYRHVMCRQVFSLCPLKLFYKHRTKSDRIARGKPEFYPLKFTV